MENESEIVNSDNLRNTMQITRPAVLTFRQLPDLITSENTNFSHNFVNFQTNQGPSRFHNGVLLRDVLTDEQPLPRTVQARPPYVLTDMQLSHAVASESINSSDMCCQCEKTEECFVGNRYQMQQAAECTVRPEPSRSTSEGSNSSNSLIYSPIRQELLAKFAKGLVRRKVYTCRLKEKTAAADFRLQCKPRAKKLNKIAATGDHLQHKPGAKKLDVMDSSYAECPAEINFHKHYLRLRSKKKFKKSKCFLRNDMRNLKLLNQILRQMCGKLMGRVNSEMCDGNIPEDLLEHFSAIQI